MKLALSRAMLLEPDMLLLDEPTNHLDQFAVKWLTEYVINLKTCTCLLVSHDTKFLDAVCTNIIHYENLKLKSYRGNLSDFVKTKPEAKAYYELSSDLVAFSFPEPGNHHDYQYHHTHQYNHYYHNHYYHHHYYYFHHHYHHHLCPHIISHIISLICIQQRLYQSPSSSLSSPVPSSPSL